MTTKKLNLVPMSIRIDNNKVLCNKFGNDFLDLLGDLGWDYQRMSRSGRETYDEMMQMIGILEEGEVYMEID